MKNLKIFCLSLEPSHYEFIKNLGYTPVGLGEKNFNNNWFTDKSGSNISQKNKYYGEYTFHYWLWKNYLDSSLDDTNSWIGFCQYRKFWSTRNDKLLPNNIDEIKSFVLKEIPQSYNNYDVILGEPFFVNNFKMMKFLKHGFKLILKNPSYLFNKNKRNIKFHFDLMHGYKNLDKAIELLEPEDRKDFNEFVNSKTYFNPQNMFICKSKTILKNYYSIACKAKELSKYQGPNQQGQIEVPINNLAKILED